jgi:hypothetical protein
MSKQLTIPATRFYTRSAAVRAAQRFINEGRVSHIGCYIVSDEIASHVSDFGSCRYYVEINGRRFGDLATLDAAFPNRRMTR